VAADLLVDDERQTAGDDGCLDLSVLVVSYNTREYTENCLRSLDEQTRGIRFEVIVVDNASCDGSVEMVAEKFPHVRLFALEENRGFARANNFAAERALGRYLLLLNPDTLVLDGAVTKLHEFATRHPRAGIYGGRTLDGDGKLDPSCCWAAMTPWSLFCRASGLSSVFPGTALFDSETYGGWQRDDVREVSIITGCFLLIERRIWNELGGFDGRYFMYGEEADLCLRAGERNYRPLFCPTAEIIHYGGKSEKVRADKVVRLMAARALLIDAHWNRPWRGFGRAMQALWALRRKIAWEITALVRPAHAAERVDTYREIWRRRREWLRPEEVPVTNRPRERQAGESPQ